MANNVVSSRTTVETEVSGINARSRGLILHRMGRIGAFIVPVAGYFFLWAPIMLLVLFSFNDSRALNAWRGFTFEWYANIFNDVVGTEVRFSTSLMLSSFANSLFVSFIASAIATVLGTMIALSLARGRYFGKKFLDGLLFLPIVIPEITQGVSLAMFFMIAFNFMRGSLGMDANYGFETIIIGHVVFNLSYVAVVVRVRLADTNPRLEEAARDLGANGWHTFWRITFPQILPGIIAGALLAFTLSLDDFVVTFFNAGVGTTTLPVFVYGLLKTNVTPEINAISTLTMLMSTLLIGFSLLLQGRRVTRL